MTMLMDGASQALTTDSLTYTTVDSPALFERRGSEMFEAYAGTGMPGTLTTLSLRGVPRAATTGGMTLGSSTEGLVAELYNLASISTLIETFDKSTAREWQDVLGETGAGSVGLLNTDAKLASIQGDSTDLVMLKYRGQNALMIWLEDWQKITRTREEEYQQLTVWGGRGHLALIERMLVNPSGGVERVPIQDDRYFDWRALEFNHAAWLYAASMGLVVDVQQSWGGSTNTWDAEFPDPTALVLGPSSGSPTTAPVGTNFLRQDFSVPSDGRYGLYALADNVAKLYIDGQLILTVGQGIEMTAFQQTASEAVDLSAGAHIMAIELTNVALASGNNPTGVAWSLHTPGELGQVGTMIEHSNASARIVEYPSEAPGMTPGEAFWIPIAENLADGYLPGLTRTWTNLVDSNGVPWPVVGGIATKVGTDCYTFGRELSTYMEISMTPGKLQLNAYNLGGEGTSRSVVFSKIESLIHRGEVNVTTVLLARYFPGWAKRENAAGVAAYGKAAALISVGALDSTDELNRVLDGQLDLFARPRQMVEQGVVPQNDAERPYIGYRKGDTIPTEMADGSTSNERLQSITITEQGDRVLVDLVLRDLLVDADVRFANLVKKLENGAMLGRASDVAQPFAFNPG